MRCLVLGVLILGGCQRADVTGHVAPAVPEPVPLAAEFDADSAGRIEGVVRWEGPVPVVEPLLGALPDRAGYRWMTRPNPFTPSITDGGLANAVVSLRAVEPAKSKPWDHAPVEVTLHDYEFRTPAGEPLRVAIAQAGAAITFVSRDPELHAARARGAAFFTLPFPIANSPLRRVLAEPGLVELTSGAGHFWMAADVVVSPHPYVTPTNPDGLFALENVPPGNYELVCRVRNWHVTRTERDPETGLHFRQFYAEPVTLTQPIHVPAAGVVTQNWTLTAEQFAPQN